MPKEDIKTTNGGVDKERIAELRKHVEDIAREIELDPGRSVEERMTASMLLRNLELEIGLGKMEQSIKRIQDILDKLLSSGQK